MVEPEFEKEIMDVEHSECGQSEQSEDLLLLSETPVQKNEINQKAKEVEVIDITIDSEVDLFLSLSDF